MTWNVTCTYSQFLAQKTPTCCVSLSSFYNDTIVPCPTCTCGCQNNSTHSGSCVEYVLSNRLLSYTCVMHVHMHAGIYLFVSYLFTVHLQSKIAAFSISCFDSKQEQLCTFGPMHKSYVSSTNSLARKA